MFKYRRDTTQNTTHSAGWVYSTLSSFNVADEPHGYWSAAWYYSSVYKHGVVEIYSPMGFCRCSQSHGGRKTAEFLEYTGKRLQSRWMFCWNTVQRLYFVQIRGPRQTGWATQRLTAKRHEYSRAEICHFIYRLTPTQLLCRTLPIIPQGTGWLSSLSI